MRMQHPFHYLQPGWLTPLLLISAIRMIKTQHTIWRNILCSKGQVSSSPCRCHVYYFWSWKVRSNCFHLHLVSHKFIPTSLRPASLFQPLGNSPWSSHPVLEYKPSSWQDRARLIFRATKQHALTLQNLDTLFLLLFTEMICLFSVSNLGQTSKFRPVCGRLEGMSDGWVGSYRTVPQTQSSVPGTMVIYGWYRRSKSPVTNTWNCDRCTCIPYRGVTKLYEVYQHELHTTEGFPFIRTLGWW